MTTRNEPAPAPAPTDGIVRIEHDRRRLLLRLLAGLLALAAIGVGLAVALLHLDAQPAHLTGVAGLDKVLQRHAYGAPWWAPAALAFAVVGACLGLVRTLIRMQDADPALVVSPRGLRFRPTLLGEQATVPWSAIRGMKLRQHKQQRFLMLRIDEIDRHVPRLGIRGWLRHLFRPGARDGSVALAVVMSKAEWKRTEALLRGYLARYGKPDAKTAATAA